MIVYGLSVVPDYPEKGTTFVSKEAAKRADCDCRILLGVKVNDAARAGADPEFATVAAPCRPEHASIVNEATERIREQLEDPALKGNSVIHTVDECLAAIER
jgi:hypothetical protein